jgi:hypothetical protein
MTVERRQRFHMVAFDAAGQLVGQTAIGGAELSPDWARFLDGVLAAHGDRFAISLPGSLARIALRFTAASGAAIGTFSTRGHLANSLLLLSGHHPDAENEVSEMFRRSVSTMVARIGATKSDSPFCDLTDVTARPLACVVAWGTPQVSDEDNELIKELSWHLASVYFAREQPEGRHSSSTDLPEIHI